MAFPASRSQTSDHTLHAHLVYNVHDSDQPLFVIYPQFLLIWMPCMNHCTVKQFAHTWLRSRTVVGKAHNNACPLTSEQCSVHL